MRRAYADSDSDKHADEYTDSDEHANAKTNKHPKTDEHAKARADRYAIADEYVETRTDLHAIADEYAKARAGRYAIADEHAEAGEQAKAHISASTHNTLPREACGYAGATVRIRRRASVLFRRAGRCSGRAVSAFGRRPGRTAFCGHGRG